MLQEKDKKNKTNISNNYFYFKTITVFHKLIKNSVWVLFVFDIIIFLFYFFGNYFNYIDTTLNFLLKTLSVSSLILSLLSLIGIIENIVYMFVDKKYFLRIISVLFMILTFCIGIVFILYSSVLLKLSFGI